MRLHALVSDPETARAAVAGGATVVQLRLKGMSTEEVRERGRPVRRICQEAGIIFVVNDDVQAALALGADGVHLGQRDTGADRALEGGLLLGLSAATVEEASAAERRGASYVGAGPVWETPSKADADPPIGIRGLEAICSRVEIPVVAIGGIDAGNAAACLAAGATGVAVVREAARAASIRRAIDHAAV